MIRALRPTDVWAYVTFCHRVARGQPNGSGGGGLPSFRTIPVLVAFLGRSLALELGRETWVQIDHGRISGLVAAKRRDRADVWDVDQLALLPSADSGRTCVRLLEQLLTAAADEGIQKVFLRLVDDDPAQEWVRQVGFFQYCNEVAYYRPELPTFARPPNAVRLRPRRLADHQALFQMYCSAVPFRVRQAEGMTLHEWRWTDGWAVQPVGIGVVIGGPRSDFVVASSPGFGAWLQVDRRVRRLTVLTDVQGSLDVADVLRFGMARLGPARPAWCAARDYQPGLANALEDNGFSSVRREGLFARALAARIPELNLVPVRAS
jgi:hypothetical protein